MFDVLSGDQSCGFMYFGSTSGQVLTRPADDCARTRDCQAQCEQNMNDKVLRQFALIIRVDTPRELHILIGLSSPSEHIYVKGLS